MRYALDSLGWFEFEGLCQALLKVTLGLGIEAWGGGRDWGRDAYFSGRLPYPGKEAQDGPFVFQAKFVENANAAGAEPRGAIVSAVDAECRRIEKRKQFPPFLKLKSTWVAPRVYALLTNACLPAQLREELRLRFQQVLPDTHVEMHDGGDICAWLDTAPGIHRAFPQLWSIRDIDQILRQVVLSDVLTRSRVALDEARLVAPVFVATSAYRRALDTLQKNAFVVLEGPPEMGKTAIGRMISLDVVTRGWEALECRDSDDVMRAYRAGASQLFVADDFFGRTEYDSRRATGWMQDLPAVIPLLNRDHWLVLTTRAHLLNFAKLTMEFSGRASVFPEKGELIVDASNLSTSEKEKIVYRHLKHSVISPEVRRSLRGVAPEIVNSPHFTPERVRRLAAETIPGTTCTDLKLLQLKEICAEGMRNPTKAMSTSFRRLRAAEKWMMFSLVEQREFSLSFGGNEAVAALRSSYDRLCPSREYEPYEDVLSALTSGFVRRRSNGTVGWIHPSCRDLTIAELRRDARYRTRFLEVCSHDGLAFALSTGGGPTGDIHLPLMESANDWATLEKRILASESAVQAAIRPICSSYLTSLQLPEEALAEKREFFRRLVQDTLWGRASAMLDENDSWSPQLLELYLTVGGHRSRPSYRPKVQEVWDAEREDALRQAQSNCMVHERTFGTFASLARLLDQEGLTGLVDGFDSAVRAVADAWLAVYESEQGVSYDWSEDSRSEREEIASEYRSLAEEYTTLAEVALLEHAKSKLLDAAANFEDSAAEVGDMSESGGAGDPEIDDDSWRESHFHGGERNDPFSDL